ncbi:MAG: twin-arginine translocation signal domain-containing protein [Halobacteriaceae archaeon]
MFGPGVDRREFLKAALAIGGTGALGACVERQGTVDVPRGDPSALPDRQFAWNDALPTGPHGNVKLPNHQLLLFLDYVGEGPATGADREQVAAAMETLEAAYQYGTGDAFNPTTTRGLLTMLAYSPSYYDRYEGSFPTGVSVPRPETVVDELGEDARADTFDALLVLTSDEVQVLLAAEQALRGRLDTLNGVDVAATFEGVFDVVDRRTGFLGVGRPAAEFDAPVSENSPTAMGYRSGFKDNQATERTVAVDFGPLADATTMQVSRLTFDLDSWYEYSEPERVHRMFSPAHTPTEVGEIGEHLGGRSRITRETAKRTDEDAREHDLVGHTQKVARARDQNFEPTILRRSEGVSTDLAQPSMNFVSVQRRMERFLEVRRKMNGADLETDLPEENNGILGFIDVTRRATFLVPPREHRALPPPTP